MRERKKPFVPPLGMLIQKQCPSLRDMPQEILIERIMGRAMPRSAKVRIMNRALVRIVEERSKDENGELALVRESISARLVGVDSSIKAINLLAKNAIGDFDQERIERIANAITDIALSRCPVGVRREALEKAWAIMRVLGSEQRKMMIRRLNWAEKIVGTSPLIAAAKAEVERPSDTVVRNLGDMKRTEAERVAIEEERMREGIVIGSDGIEEASVPEIRTGPADAQDRDSEGNVLLNETDMEALGPDDWRMIDAESLDRIAQEIKGQAGLILWSALPGVKNYGLLHASGELIHAMAGVLQKKTEHPVSLPRGSEMLVHSSSPKLRMDKNHEIMLMMDQVRPGSEVEPANFLRYEVLAEAGRGSPGPTCLGFLLISNGRIVSKAASYLRRNPNLAFPLFKKLFADFLSANGIRYTPERGRMLYLDLERLDKKGIKALKRNPEKAFQENAVRYSPNPIIEEEIKPDADVDPAGQPSLAPSSGEVEEEAQGQVRYYFEEGRILIELDDFAGMRVPQLELDLGEGDYLRYQGRFLVKDEREARDAPDIPKVRALLHEGEMMESQVIVFSGDGPVEHKIGKIRIMATDKRDEGLMLEILGQAEDLESIKGKLPNNIPIFGLDSLHTAVFVDGFVRLLNEMELLKEARMAIIQGSLDRVIELVEEEFLDPEAKDEEGTKLLMRAAAFGRDDICEYLVLEKKVDVNARNNNGFNALMFASARYEHDNADSLIRKLKIARLFLDNGAELDPNDPRGANVAIGLAKRFGLNETAALIEERMAKVRTSDRNALAIPACEIPKRTKKVTESVLIIWVPEPGENIIERGEAGPQELYLSNTPHDKDRSTSKLFRLTQPLPMIANADGPGVEVDVKMISPYLSEDESVQILYADKSDVPPELATLFPEGEWRWVCPAYTMHEGASPLGKIRLAGEWMLVFDKEIEGTKKLKSMELHCSMSDKGEVTEAWGREEILQGNPDYRIIRALVGMRLEKKENQD